MSFLPTITCRHTGFWACKCHN